MGQYTFFFFLSGLYIVHLQSLFFMTAQAVNVAW